LQRRGEGAEHLREDAQLLFHGGYGGIVRGEEVHVSFAPLQVDGKA
jgi:hypothetical protein